MKKFYCITAYYTSKEAEEAGILSFAHTRLPAENEDDAYMLIEKYTDENKFWYCIANFYVFEEGTDFIPK